MGEAAGDACGKGRDAARSIPRPAAHKELGAARVRLPRRRATLSEGFCWAGAANALCWKGWGRFVSGHGSVVGF